MNIFYLRKIIRDDKAVFEFDQEEIYLAEDNALLARPEVETTAIDYTAADGGEYIAQKLPSYSQQINGLVIPKASTFWTLYDKLVAFFKPNHTYALIYEKISGEQISVGERFKTGAAWIEQNLQVPPRPKEDYAEWSVTLRIGVPGLQEYAEDESGEETYANSVNVPLLSATVGGQLWDEVGAVWDEVGAVWTAGEGGIKEITIASTSSVYPVWVVEGSCVNPSIRDNTTNTVASYEGSVASGQTLVVDFEAGTATLDGVVVTRNLSGTLKLEPGTNLLGFSSDGGDAQSSTLKWNNRID